MNETAQFFTDADLPPADAARSEDAYQRIMRRHVLATLKAGHLPAPSAESAQGQRQPVLDGPGSISVSALLDYLQSLSYHVDEEWLANSLLSALPARRDLTALA